MLRFIIRRKMHDRFSGLTTDDLETIDADCPDLERVLRGGGSGQEAYDHRSVAGVEVLPDSDGMLQTLADRIKRLGLEIFDRPECPQEVRDAIEWFAAELSVSRLTSGVMGTDGAEQKEPK